MKVKNMIDDTQTVAPWYKQPWLWFILTPLIAVFIYGFTFLYLSIVTMDGVVKDDYYRLARGYEINSEKNQVAIAHNISADVKIDTVTGDIMLKLEGSLDPIPESLTLDIVHPTHQKYDQTITLKSVGSKQLYIGSLAGHLSGKRFLFLSPPDQTWSLHQEMLPPYDQQSVLMKPNR